MKIGYFNARGPNNGIEHWFDLEMEELQKRGHEVRVFWLKGNQPTQEDRKWMDIAHFHFAQVAEYYKKLRVPYLISPHANDIFMDNGRILQLASNNPKCIGVTYQSYYHEKKFKEWNINKPLFYLPMCVRVDLFKRQIPYNPLGKIIAGGRLIPKKGLDRLNDVGEITIFGDGPLMTSLRNKLKLANFTGSLSGNQLKDLFEESSIYLFPAIITPEGDSDGIPNTIKEAMLMQLHVISSSVSGIPELENISILNDWSKPSITNALNSIPKESNKKGEKEIRNIYSPVSCVNRLEKIFNEFV